MAIDDRIAKHDAFERIVGKTRGNGRFPGDVPDFEIPASRIDEVYLIVKKMQRCYATSPENPTGEYYAESFANVEKAYLSQCPSAFKEAVRELMVDIDSD